MASHRIDQDRKAIQKAINLPRPAGVEDVEIELSADAAGEPAVFLWVVIADDVEQSKVDSFATDLRDAVLKSGVHLWPYVRMRQAA